ncbi:hypothetical protein SLNSH_02785 [Alsobacter soli]|uniref:Spore coat protein n=1 Tax=Alsobacter soli TaxID=2109933 RepID=A0A2T1HZ28_9HYPH|nr:hypothetical protein [Alsobacter soli]PSC06739.1 hypothetical protein SLNSH_02785 [Alsobacter soli]
MKALTIATGLLLLSSPAFAQFTYGTGSSGSSHYVQPHYNSNGSYTSGHYQTNSDGYGGNNYGASGNYNPNNGMYGNGYGGSNRRSPY